MWKRQKGIDEGCEKSIEEFSSNEKKELNNLSPERGEILRQSPGEKKKNFIWLMGSKYDGEIVANTELGKVRRYSNWEDIHILPSQFQSSTYLRNNRAENNCSRTCYVISKKVKWQGARQER